MSNQIVVVCIVLWFAFADALRNSGTGMHSRLHLQEKEACEIYKDNKLLATHDTPVGNTMLPWRLKLPDFLGREKENEQLYKAAERGGFQTEEGGAHGVER